MTQLIVAFCNFANTLKNLETFLSKRMKLVFLIGVSSVGKLESFRICEEPFIQTVPVSMVFRSASQ